MEAAEPPSQHVRKETTLFFRATRLLPFLSLRQLFGTVYLVVVFRNRTF